MRCVIAFTAVVAVAMAGCGGDTTESGAEVPSTDPIASSSAAAEAEDDERDEGGVAVAAFEVSEDLAYADGVLLDVYRPTADGPWPVVVFAPGRGASKDLGEVKIFGRTYAEHGAVAYLIAMADDPPFLETVEQVSCAVRFARATAVDHGGDPDRVVLVGFSLGASIGAVVGLSGDDHTAGCVETDVSALPDALVGYEGPYDWAHADYPLDLALLEPEDPELWAAIDPYAHIGENPDLTVRLIHGVDDNHAWWELPPEVSEEFQQALETAGYDAEVVLIEGASHSGGMPGVPQFDAIVAEALTVAESN